MKNKIFKKFILSLIFILVFFISFSYTQAVSDTGTFESNLIDLGVKANIEGLSWTATGVDLNTQNSCTQLTGSGCALKFQISFGLSTSSMSAYVGPDGTGATYFTVSSEKFSQNVNSIGRYVKYKAYLYTKDTNYTPKVSNVKINYQAQPTSLNPAEFISSIYDTKNEYNAISSISFNEFNVSNTAKLRLQLRSASSSSAILSESWYGPSGTSTYFENGAIGCSKSGDIVVCNTVDQKLKSGVDGRYIQYRVLVNSTSGDYDVTSNPYTTSISITYNDNSVPNFVSAPLNLNKSTYLLQISWTEINVTSTTESFCTKDTGEGCAVKLQIRTAPDSNGSPDWANGSGWCGPTDCAQTTSNTDYASSYFTYKSTGCAKSGDVVTCTAFPNVFLSGGDDQWFQYKVYLNSINPTAYTPKISQFKISYNQTQVKNGTFLSSPYDTVDNTTFFASLSWSEKDTSSTEKIKFQIRTAPDANGSPDWANGSGWCGPTDCAQTTSNTDYASSYFSSDYVDCSKTTASSYVAVNCPNKNATTTDAINDRWIQYRIVLESSGSISPKITSDVGVQATYVSNEPPQLYLKSASQSTTDGKVYISFIAADPDTNATKPNGDPSAANPGKVLVKKLEYSLDGGSTWSLAGSDTNTNSAYITTDTNSGYAGTNPFVDIPITTSTTTSQTFTIVWDAKGQLGNNIEVSNAKIRLTIDDRELSKNLAISESSIFVLDTKPPVISETPIYSTYLIGTSTSNNLHIVSSDGNSYQLMLSNNSNFSNDGINAQSGQWINPSGATTTLTWNFGSSDPYKVYLKAKDIYQNVSTITMQAPEKPKDIFIADITTEFKYREFVSWNKVADPESDFKSYNIFRSTDNQNWTLYKVITDINTNFLIDDNNGTTLDQNLVYYYKVVAEDNKGNTSNYSNVVYDQPDLARGSTDLAAPVISNLRCTNVTAGQLTVEWDTDEVSDSTVYYSTDTSYSASTTVVTMVKSQNSPYGGHKVVLTDLNPATTYNLRIKSTDPFGNYALNDASNPGNLPASAFQCTTQGGPKITNVSPKSVDENSATISWRTNVPANSTVVYTTDPNFQTGLQTVTTNDLVVDHNVLITGLSVNTRYYFKVLSKDASSVEAFDDNAGKYYQFATTQDTTPPQISNVSASLTKSDSAVITWLTNEPSDSEVINISGGSFTNPNKDSTLTTKHSIVLTGLQPQTTYTYAVRSTDKAGNTATSSQYSFTTPEESKLIIIRTLSPAQQGASVQNQVAKVEVKVDKKPPIIKNLTVSNITDSSVVIKWETDEPATSLVEYGETRKYGFTQGTFKKSLFHEVKLTDLRPGRKYNYIIRSMDDAGNMSESANKVFSTKPAKETIEEKLKRLKENPSPQEIAKLTAEINQILENLNKRVTPPAILGPKPSVDVGSTWAKISWETDRVSGSVVAYSEAKDYDPSKPDIYKSFVGNPDEQVTQHFVELTNLKPGTLYHFQVRSKALIGGIGKSKDFTFKTKEEGEIVDLEIKNITTNSAEISWKTNVFATTNLEYGKTANFTDKITDSTLNKSHFVKLTNLQPGTLYRFRAGGKDENGNQFYSPTLTFTTQALPSLIDVKIDALTERSVNISWVTDVPSDSTVYYTNTKTNKTEKIGAAELVKNHLIKLDNLEEGVEYKIKVASTDANGNTIESSEYSFTTSKDSQPPIILNVKTQSALFGRNKVQTIIKWDTDEPAISRVVYQEALAGKKAEKTKDVSLGPVKSHTAVFTDFKAGTVYKFKLISIDKSGNVAESQYYTILTPREQETVFDLIVKNFKDVFKWTQNVNR